MPIQIRITVDPNGHWQAAEYTFVPKSESVVNLFNNSGKGCTIAFSNPRTFNLIEFSIPKGSDAELTIRARERTHFELADSANLLKFPVRGGHTIDVDN